MRGADAVGTGVAAADDDDVLVLRRDLVGDLVAGAHVVGLGEVLHGEVHAREVAAGDRQLARDHGTGGDDHGVVATSQFVPGDVDADVHSGAEAGALRRHLLEALVDVPLLHLEVGDAVAQQAADAVVALEDGDGVSGARQLLGRGEAGGAGADDGDGLAGEASGRVRLHPSAGEGLVDDRHLDLLDGDSRLVDAEDAGGLARRRAQTTRELREVVRGVQPLDGRVALAAPGEVVPLGDEVAERAALVAERHAAVHAAAGLATQLGGVTLLVHLFPVHEPHRNRAAGGQFAIRGLQESLGVSHRSPPSLE